MNFILWENKLHLNKTFEEEQWKSVGGFRVIPYVNLHLNIISLIMDTYWLTE